MIVILVLVFGVELFLLHCISKKRPSNIKDLLRTPLFYPFIFIFSFVNGIRNNDGVDVDFLQYQEIVSGGKLHYYYEHMEFFPRLFIDFIHEFNLYTYVWFILMAFVLIVLLIISNRCSNWRYLIISVFSFFLLYLPLYNGIIRQGCAVTCFLCAITYIGKSEWKKYLFFIVVGFCFHRSSLLWAPVYFLSLINTSKITKTKVMTIFLIGFSIAGALAWLANAFGDLLLLSSYANGVESVAEGQTEEIALGSGYGIILRYIRWIVLLILIPKAAQLYGRGLWMIYFVFIIGVSIDYGTMFSIQLSRVACYAQTSEILLFPFLYGYSKQCKRNSRFLIRSVLLVEFLLYSFTFMEYLNKWNFVKL